MKISISLAMAVSLASTAVAEPLFQTSRSAVFSNFDSVAELPPQVVLGYLAHCADVADVMVPEHADCLFDNYVRLQFPGDEFGGSCSLPDISISEITSNLQAANAICDGDFDDFIATATFLVLQVFEAESCWTSLCHNDILLRVESQYVEQCTGVDLPYPLDSSDDMFLSQEEETDAILTCMLEHVMNTPALEFGFDEPPVQCWPPAYGDIGIVCPTSLAKPAFDHCTKNTPFFDVLEEDMIFMSMSMMMDDGDDYKPDDEMLLLERFCAILDGITTEKGLECLGIICDNASAMPSGAPSDEWSAIPSGAPSETFSSAPTESSSAMPSDSPSVAPSASPSSSPTASPSSEPSQAPSSAPTLNDLQYIVEMDVVSELVLDMATSDVPDLFGETVEESILSILSNSDVDAVVEILSVGGNALRRRLQNAIPVQFRVQATEECRHPDCDEFAANLIATLNLSLLNAVVNGSMETAIREEATSRGVDVLTTVNVIANSYQVISSEFQLNDPVIVTNPEEVQSAATLASSLASLALLLVSLFVFF